MRENLLLEVNNLCTYFPITQGVFRRKVGDLKAVDGISLQIFRGETFGLVGESGCGKSTLMRSILRLIEPTCGEIRFCGENITSLAPAALRSLRRKMQVVFQNPYASLNPRMTIGDIVSEPLKIHEPNLTPLEMNDRVFEMLRLVGIDDSAVVRYPHHFSGGQRQRISIARALILRPALIFCDEPVSALDVSIRSQVLNLMRELQEKLDLTYLFISHDLSVVKYISDRVGVMYLGKLVEVASKKTLFQNPLHPYTQALMSAIPIPDPKVSVKRIVLQGDVPSPAHPPSGCRFHTRCVYATEACARPANVPPLIEVEEGHFVSCFKYQK
ncbi:MAG: ABC transporter ATP-binding protein [Bacteroidota bacterium]